LQVKGEKNRIQENTKLESFFPFSPTNEVLQQREETLPNYSNSLFIIHFSSSFDEDNWYLIFFHETINDEKIIKHNQCVQFSPNVRQNTIGNNNFSRFGQD
jgi:hypothetical protein